MNTRKMALLRATSGVLCAVITQATLASASADCKARYPATFNNCENVGLDRAQGSGRDVSGNIRRISVTFRQGTAGARALLLSTNGTVQCATNTATAAGQTITLDCNVAASPGTLELRVFAD